MPSADWSVFVDFAQPGYLALLALLPFVVVLGVRSLSGLGRVRRPLAVSLRCLVILVLSVALAGPDWVRVVDDQAVVFAVDQSDSVPADVQRAAAEFVRSSVAGLRPGKDRVGLLAFDGRPSVEQVPRPTLVVEQLGRPIEPHRTNVAAALRLGLALLPADAARRLVVLSDGNENVGRAAEEAATCAALGIPIDVVPLRYTHAAEMLVDSLTAPAVARRDEAINLQLVVRSQVAAGARLRLYHNEQLVPLDAAGPGAGSLVALDAGPNRLTIPFELRSPGVHRFRAVVQADPPEADTLPYNNEGRAFTIVGAAERVLIVADTAADSTGVNKAAAALLAEALRRGGIECDMRSVDELPEDPAALADCSTVLLSNVSAFALQERRQQGLASYVRDQGGGLIVIGGDQAFSVGGYACTALEEILPVETGRERLKLLSLSLVIVIDRSGSMAGEKLDMARRAAVASVQVLGPLDRVGVIAFDSLAEWVVPLQPAGQRAAIMRAIAAIGSGGGTDMYPALVHAAAALADVTTNLKHIIALTDGQSAPGEFETLARRCGAAGITISSVAVGPDADRELLERIAQLSGGRMYVADDAQPLPQIFVRETVLAGRSGLVEQPFTPALRRVVDNQIVAGLAPADIPPLRGYVVTAIKPLAQASLVRTTEDGADPILAHWPVGLGRVVAFTSGLWPKWGPEWVAWPGFSKLWTQAVRYAGRPGNPADLDVEAAVKDGQGHVVVSAERLPLRLLGSLNLAGRLVRPDFTAENLPVPRTGAHRFEATFPLDSPGTYLVNIAYGYGPAGEGRTGVLRTGVVLSYSPEYRTLRDDAERLTDVARRTGGRVLDLGDPDTVFDAGSIRPAQVRRPLWEDLIRLTLLLFLLDVAVRRIAVSPAEVVRRGRDFVHGLAGRPAAGDSAATLATLRGVKDRTRDAVAPAPAPQAAELAAPPPPVPPREPDALTRALEGSGPAQPVVAPPEKPRPATTSESEYTSRLLRVKRRARGDQQE
ncbi:MAG: VWA domain-containing protein [Planctomycetota bacterium]